MASELAKAGDLQKTSNGIKCKTISKCGQEQMEEYNRRLVCLHPGILCRLKTILPPPACWLELIFLDVD